ncbi:MAG: RNA polymerase sigma-70 factor (ECF subfamily) [Myxococcota bacterium]|jgi:RNA polymerase sigma-70 factor (ECF subfamily)
MNALIPLVSEDLRRTADRYVNKGGGHNHSLQATRLVYEVFMRLVGSNAETPTNRVHFMAVAATAMRQILTDHVRRRRAAKRGGDFYRVTLSGLSAGRAGTGLDIIAVHDALARLDTIDPHQARVVELRIFAGLSNPEIAEVLGIGLRTVEKEWRRVKAWLASELSGDQDA